MLRKSVTLVHGGTECENRDLIRFNFLDLKGCKVSLYPPI